MSRQAQSCELLEHHRIGDARMAHFRETLYIPRLDWAHFQAYSEHPQQDYCFFLMLVEQANKRWIECLKEHIQKMSSATPLEEEGYMILDKGFEHVAAMDVEYVPDASERLKRAELEGSLEPADGRGGGSSTCKLFESRQDPSLLVYDLPLDG